MAFGTQGPDLYGTQRRWQQNAQQTAQQMQQPGYGGRLKFGPYQPQPVGPDGDGGTPRVAAATGGPLQTPPGQPAIPPFNANVFANNDWYQPPPQVPPPQDWNTVSPGPYENMMAFMGGQLFNEGPGQQYFNQNRDAFTAPDANQQLYEQQQAAGPMANNAQVEYDAFGARRPNIATEPGYGSYYDNAENKTIAALNTQLGARGAYGSSVGLGQLGQSITDLRADQARTEADYNLKRLEEQRNWTELGGSLARNADLSGQGNLDAMGKLASNASDSRMKGLATGADVAGMAGDENLKRTLGAYGAWHDLQTVRDDRIRKNLKNQSDEATMTGGIYQAIADALTKGDLGLLDAQLSGYIGEKGQALNALSGTNLLGGITNIVGLAKALQGLGGDSK